MFLATVIAAQLRRLEIAHFFQTNKHILFLDTGREIISKQNLARVLSTHKQGKANNN